MTIVRRASRALVLGAVLAGASAMAVSAQEAPAPTESTMVVLFERADEPGALDPREVLSGSVTALADGVECARLDFEGPEGWLVLGGDVQPAACSTEGATITFVNGADQTLFETLTFAAGTTASFMNLAPMPASTGVGAPAAPGSGSAGLVADLGDGKVPSTSALLAVVGLVLALGGGWVVRGRIAPMRG